MRRLTVSPVAYKLASNSAMMKSFVLLIIKCMMVLGTKSLVVLVTIFMYESTKLRIVSTYTRSIQPRTGQKYKNHFLIPLLDVCLV